MTAFIYLVKRNTKLFFKDKGAFFAAMIAPLILLVVFVIFLGNMYRNSINNSIPEGVILPEKIIEGFVGGWLLSSLLAVSCITVAFCANMIMVQDKVTGAISDLSIAPVKKPILALSYYVSTMLITALICYTTTVAGFVYLARIGWYLSPTDIVYILLDVMLLVLFGTAFSSIICYFLRSQGGITAVGTIASSCYGFICGAYMPISQFTKSIQNVISILPGTYGTGLLRNHFMQGVLTEIGINYFPKEVVDVIRDDYDIHLYFMNELVTVNQMYLILIAAVGVLILLYVIMNVDKTRKIVVNR